MPIFALQRGPTPLCEWDLDRGDWSVHGKAEVRDGVLVLSEEAKVGFKLEPADDSFEYRILIGDVSLVDIIPTADHAAGIPIAGSLFWPDFTYFDSARARTKLALERRPIDGNDNSWLINLTVELYVVPGKLGEERYYAMSSDLSRVSHSLLSDLYGKSKRLVDIRNARGAKAHLSREAELRAIENTLSRIASLLRSISRRPASRIITVANVRQYWGDQHLNSSERV